MPRIDPLQPRAWSSGMLEALAQIDPRTHGKPQPELSNRPSGRDVLSYFARHPDLAHAFFHFNGHVLFGSTLTARQVEILALRVAARRQFTYLWAHHLFAAREAGLTQQEIGQIVFGPAAPFLDPLDRALLCAVDELIEGGSISTHTWEQLAERLDEKQLLDIIFTIGCYETVGSFTHTLGLVPDPEIPGLLAQ
ncbi:Carboxymuconolactone decarboxylase [Parafrankia sp. EAN1pec]|uniref:carboxymuconolactone decarboxylase family protein n=1 Tax=Parafrankia sp. (strain EAN1pec) TaxID=298653 RepID=UPI000054213C|nr:Carboxymuconolactone decarboxylase [Frankia sp. EAN1pec]